MANDRDVIAFKTSAWQSPGMVAAYAASVHKTTGVNRLKNQVEVGLCREFVTGKRVIDVGVGTGRAGIPLARDGYSVTGVDTSDAMLRQCKREAASVPIELIQGDVTSLPARDESFDSLVSVNVASHFPNWAELLAEWTRVIKPGGRLIFDIHSYDHLAAVAAYRGTAPESLLTEAQRTVPEHFFAYAKTEELVASCESLGLSLVATVPYGSLYGGQNFNYWITDGLLEGAAGDRMLAWLTVDERMYEFAAFIEQQTVARLSIAATPRFMVVFEKGADPGKTMQTLERARAADAALLRGDAAGFAGSAEAGKLWLQRLMKHLEHAPNRALAMDALSSPSGRGLRSAVAGWLGDMLCAELFDAHDRLAAEREALDLLARIRDRVSEKHLAAFAGIDFANTLDYEGLRAILTATYFAANEPLAR